MNTKRPTVASRATWAAAQAAAVRRQIEDASRADTGGDWRRRAQKARTMHLLREREARYRRMVGAEADPDLAAPF